MYCKYCGKELKDGTRFCSRCGKSQRSAGAETGNGDIADEDIAIVSDDPHAGKKFNIKALAAIIIISAILVVASFLTTYLYMSGHLNEDWKHTDGAVELNASTPKPEASFDTALSTEEANRIKPYVTSIYDEKNGYEASYPSAFIIEAADDAKTLFQAAAPGGVDAHMYITSETVPAGKSAADLLKEYASANGGRVIYGSASDTLYITQLEQASKSYYKKCIITGDTALSFEFVSDESLSAEYDDFVRYISASLHPLNTPATAAPSETANDD